MNQPDPLAALKRARDIIAERGWAALFALDDESPLNLRNAVAKACTDLAGGNPSNGKLWHQLYLGACHALGEHLHSGITSWEANIKTSSEVEKMLDEVINRMENGEIRQKRPVPPSKGV